jgi:hypothetical protein
MHNWKGGFGAVNLFSGLKTVTPSIHRARLKELRYNSPGIIRLNLLPSLADKIKLAMQNILPAKIYDDAERLYKEIYSYFREHKITGFDDERSDVQLELTELQKRDLDFFARKFLKILSWERHHKALQELGVTEISRLRMLLAYYRRLRRLRDFVVNGKLSLEGEFKIGE